MLSVPVVPALATGHIQQGVQDVGEDEIEDALRCGRTCSRKSRHQLRPSLVVDALELVPGAEAGKLLFDRLEPGRLRR
jgi:hypothetical protein